MDKSWKNFFDLMKKIDKGLDNFFWHKARAAVCEVRSQEYPDDGIGSSDINHLIYGEFNLYRKPDELKYQILRFYNEIFRNNVSDNMLRSMAKDTKSWLGFFGLT